MFSSTFCSHPLQACIQHITETSPYSSGLPTLSYAFSSALEPGLPAPSVTCLDSDTVLIRGNIEYTGGMLYELIARVRTIPMYNSPSGTRCTQLSVIPGAPPNATLHVPGGSAREAWITWVGGTEYSANAGNSATNYSFRGLDPHDTLFSLVTDPRIADTSYEGILAQHVADYKAALTDKFSLSLGQTPRLGMPTDYIKAAYKRDVGDPYLEWVLFNYGRYMLVSSGRGALPANLQGKWAHGIWNAWSAGTFWWSLLSYIAVADYLQIIVRIQMFPFCLHFS